MREKSKIYEKIWDENVVDKKEEGKWIIYIDRNIVNEVKRKKEFEGMKMEGRKVRKKEKKIEVVENKVKK